MAKLSKAELQAIITTYVASTKVSNATYSGTRDNIANLLDKIGKIVTLDTLYIDKLQRFDGDSLPFEKDIEEWSEDLVLPTPYDPTGANALAPNDPSYRPPFYSKTLGKEVFKTTIRNNNLERAVNNIDEFNRLTGMILKRLYDSEALFKYNAKRQIVADMIGDIEAAYSGASTYAAATSYTVGTYIKSSTEYGIVVKAITGGAAATATWALCKSNGYVILINLYTQLAVPVDTSTGEAFVTQLKQDVEIGTDVSEGHSMNGNTLGATEGLVLLVKQGIMPIIEVAVQAGAFNGEKVAMPTEIVVVPDFGNNNTDVYAVLLDARAIKLHNSYRAIREQVNADGDFINYYLHTENTAYYSRNTFVKFYKP